MKHLSILFFTAFLATSVCWSQIIGDNVFLQGSYVELGINSCGCYVSPAAPPAGYHPNSGGLGIVADSDKDGWDLGLPPFCGDYTEPGVPLEGWAVQIDGFDYYNSDDDCTDEDIPGAITAYSAGASMITADWQGTIEDYNATIHQQTILHPGDLYFITKITIINNSASVYENVYYKRNVDPDNESALTGGSGPTTYNEIVSNPPVSDDALVTAEGLNYGCYMAMGSRSANARAAFGNFATFEGTPEDVYNGTGGYNLSGSETNDIANSIAFYIPTIAAHDSATIAFAYIFNPIEAEEALAATADILIDCGPVTDATADSITETTATLNWSPVPGAILYKLKYRKTGGTWTTFTIPTPALSLISLSPCTNYQYNITTICDGVIAVPFTGSFTTTCAPCAIAPAGLAAINITASSAKLHWSAVAGATSYKIIYSAAGGTPVTTTSTSTVKMISGLTAGTMYTVKVKAICGGGSASSYSAPYAFSTLLRLGEFSESGTEISISPNPASDNITVNVAGFDAGEMHILLYDMSGRKIYENVFASDEEGNYVISISDIEQGIYTLTAEQNSLQVNKRLVVIH